MNNSKKKERKIVGYTEDFPLAFWISMPLTVCLSILGLIMWKYGASLNLRIILGSILFPSALLCTMSAGDKVTRPIYEPIKKIDKKTHK